MQAAKKHGSKKLPSFQPAAAAVPVRFVGAVCCGLRTEFAAASDYREQSTICLVKRLALLPREPADLSREFS
jgi:hypothetical protein